MIIAGPLESMTAFATRWGPGLREWDAAAGLLLVGEAGGLAGDLTGDSCGTWPAAGNVLAANVRLGGELRARLVGAYASEAE